MKHCVCATQLGFFCCFCNEQSTDNKCTHDMDEEVTWWCLTEDRDEL